MKSVAVIEDSADNRLLLHAILDNLYEVRDYETGPQALRAFATARPDLVLLDISLPGMDGVEVLSRLRGDDSLRALPVVALTAHAMTGDRERYLDVGFDEYVSKPIVDERVLLTVLARLLAL